MTAPFASGRRFEARREKIIDLAAALFAARGYAATGVTELGEAAGLGRGALYYYIESKESLLVAIQNRVLEPLLSRSRAIVDTDAPALVKLRLVSEALVGVILTRSDHIRVYENDYLHLTGDNLSQALGQRRAFQGLVQGVMEAAIRDESLRAVDPELATLQFLSLHNHTYLWAATASRRWTAIDLSREYCKTLLRGMARHDAIADRELEGGVDGLRTLLDEESPKL